MDDEICVEGMISELLFNDRIKFLNDPIYSKKNILERSFRTDIGRLEELFEPESITDIHHFKNEDLANALKKGCINRRITYVSKVSYFSILK